MSEARLPTMDQAVDVQGQNRMKQPVSADTRQKVLSLRHAYSLAELAKLTGLPVGTIKTICSRSGAFRDNMTHRALFSLPPIKASQQTALVVPELPPQLSDTGAESFCIGALAGLAADGKYGDYDADKVAARFKAHPEVMPNTLSDCLRELSFWDVLYSLRNAATPQGEYAPDHHPEVNARDDFVFRSLANIRPRHKAEAIAVLHYLAESDRMSRAEANNILSNLIR